MDQHFVTFPHYPFHFICSHLRVFGIPSMNRHSFSHHLSMQIFLYVICFRLFISFAYYIL